jgi:DNA-binding beta-propeller fold protein YncE
MGLVARLLAGVSIAASIGTAWSALTIADAVSSRQATDVMAWGRQSATAVATGTGNLLYLSYLGEVYSFDLGSRALRLVAGKLSSSPSPAVTAEGVPAGGATIRPHSLAVSPNGEVIFADRLTGGVRRIDSGRLHNLGRSPEVGGLALDSAGNVYFSDRLANRVYKIPANTSTILPFAGTGALGYGGDAGPATQARLAAPQGLALDGQSNLYIADSGNHRVRRVDLRRGTIETVAGNGRAGFAGDGKRAVEARLTNPAAVAVGSSGGLYIADTGNHRIRRVGPNGVIITLAGSGQ